MQRFRLIFHIFYVILALVIMYFSVDILLHTEQYLSKIKLSSYIKFPRYVMGVFLFISILMMIEFVLQQLKIRNIKTGIEDLESEIVELKAKLYDKSQEEPEMPDDEDEADDDEDDDDE